MAFTIGSGTFTNGSATVTGVTLTSGTLAYFASGTRMVVGVNPVIQEVEAIAAPTVTTITLRSAWTGTGGTYQFLANQTSEGLRDAVQAIRTNNASLQSFIDSIDTAATANSVAQRTSDGSLNVNVLDAAGNIRTSGDRYVFSYAGGTAGNVRAGFQLVGSGNNIRAFTNDVERMRINSAGNVGIGTTAPVDKIEAVSPVSVAYASGSAFIAPEGTKLRIANTASLDNSYSGITFSSVTSGNVTSISYIGSLATSGSTSGSIVFGQRTTSTYTERMRIDSAGNVGIGVTPSSWAAGTKALQVGSFASLFYNGTTGSTEITANARQSAGSTTNYLTSSGAARYIQSIGSTGGAHVFLSAPAGTAGDPITFLERMRIDTSGNVGIGTTSPIQKLNIADVGTGSNILLNRTVVATGPALYQGQLAFGSYTTGTTVGYSSAIQGLSGSAHTSTNSSGQMVFLTTPSGSTTLTERMRIDSSGNVLAGADNTQTLGGASNRWSVVYAGTGTINTSDAREKTPVNELTADELNAAKQLSKEIGTYQFLSAVAKKGDAARKHVGMTVQRAIEIMEANNLDPFAYGFICYDEWEEKTVEHPAVESKEAVLDEEGNVIEEAVEAKDAYTEVVQEAGNRYSFRPDEMLFFIARGLEARIEALEG